MDAPQKNDIAKREEETLAFWNERKIFEKSLSKDAPKGEYVFYDGPPFATGTPHYGHIVASVIKDAVPRYWTMRGYRVSRQWGWDCHGLPIENIVEKELGFKHKKDIVNFGIAKFNELCRSKVLMYADEWKKVIPRIGRWADMEKPYFTMSRDFMESVWWVFKQLYDNKLVYEDYRSMHICPRCETTLSQSEVTEGYKDVKDLAVTVKFELVDHPGTYFLAWTTTPWTLPGNVALAVGADIEYSKVKTESGTFILAKDRLADVLKDMPYEILGTLKGREFAGGSYKPPFDYYVNDMALKNRENGWKVYVADFVTAEEGTGIAHEAPAFGADDWELAKKFNIPFVQHVSMDGTFKSEVRDFAGRELSPRAKNIPEEVREVDLDVAKYLDEKGLLFGKEKYLHAYPHCWRCDTPLLNYATSSWFVKIEAQKDALLENAKPINWSPEHIKNGRWGKWLEGARDWSISRQRFWASVIPLWRCEKCKAERVFGSAEELEKASGKKIDDLHKHIVDEVMVPCECGGMMKRIPDVLDTWFDSGSMPYGQAHYPFADKEEFEKTFPAQFIAEGQDQTRAWFYYLHVLATSTFGTNAFENVIVNGIVLAEDGKKMSKRLQNYPDPMEVVEKFGADALRLYLLASPVMQAENLNFSEKGISEWKSVLTRLENVLSFYNLYRNDVVHEPSDVSTHVLDRWIIARLRETHAQITEAMNGYNLTAATRPLALFVDDLSTWYLRRSRERIKDGDSDAFATTLFVLRETAKMIAPFAPFMAEHLWKELKTEEDEESVHLAEWSEMKTVDERAIVQMREVRELVSKALEARDIAKIKVRQPLASLTVPEDSKPKDEYFPIIVDEVNVKQILVGNALSLDTAITEELREEGMLRDIVRDIQAFRKQSNLNPKDRGSYKVQSSSDNAAFIEKHREHLQNETNTNIVIE
jgi:isoleucyl-tRNA synthetase